eukprot:403355823
MEDERVKELFNKAQGYKEITSRARYLVNFFKNDEIPMQIFSYLWTNEQAMKRVKELNSKSKQIIDHTFYQYYSEYFTQVECSKPEPNRDIDFDDFADFYFHQYKNVRIHGIEVYDNDEYLSGLEMYYMVDGDYQKYALHHSIKRQSLKQKFGNLNLNLNPALTKDGATTQGGGLGSFMKPNSNSTLEKPQFQKKSIFFTNDEFIVSLRVTGQKYIHFIEMITNHGQTLHAGTIKPHDYDVQLDIPKGHAVMAFSGVMEVTYSECRYLNLSVITKAPDEDCDKAQSSYSYKDLIQSQYSIFNIIKSEKCDQIKRVKAVKLYHGHLIGHQQSGMKSDVVGGIQVTYELKNGQDFEDGIYDLRCTNHDLAPKFLELKDNEYITTIYGTGTDFIKTLCIETNFYRRVKMGSKNSQASGAQSPKGQGKPQLTSNKSNEFDFGTMSGNKKGSSGDQFSISMPAGAKVVAFAGTADDYLRSIVAYYKN